MVLGVHTDHPPAEIYLSTLRSGEISVDGNNTFL